jgi:hypothetical protein
MALDPAVSARIANIILQACSNMGQVGQSLDSLNEPTLAAQANTFRDNLYAMAKQLDPAIG